MTIVHARVDERLIHGQVATVWTNTVGAQRIMVVNDAAVKERKAIEKILAGNYDEEKVFLITKDIADMAALIDGGVPLQSFNVGNISQKEGSRAIKKSVALTDEDIQTVRRLTDNGVTITAQMIPSEPNEAILTFIK